MNQTYREKIYVEDDFGELNQPNKQFKTPGFRGKQRENGEYEFSDPRSFPEIVIEKD
jgi:hypothetical protein